MKKLKAILGKIASAIQNVLMNWNIVDTHLTEEPTWTKEGSFVLVIATDYRQDTYP